MTSTIEQFVPGPLVSTGTREWVDDVPAASNLPAAVVNYSVGAVRRRLGGCLKPSQPRS
jgi:hypothetical protein